MPEDLDANWDVGSATPTPCLANLGARPVAIDGGKSLLRGSHSAAPNSAPTGVESQMSESRVAAAADAELAA
jgi:hypothetical protein